MKLLWFSGQSGIRDNEIDDDLATLETGRPIMRTETAVGVYYGT